MHLGQPWSDSRVTKSNTTLDRGAHICVLGLLVSAMIYQILGTNQCLYPSELAIFGQAESYRTCVNVRLNLHMNITFLFKENTQTIPVPELPNSNANTTRGTANTIPQANEGTSQPKEAAPGANETFQANTTIAMEGKTGGVSDNKNDSIIRIIVKCVGAAAGFFVTCIIFFFLYKKARGRLLPLNYVNYLTISVKTVLVY